MDSLKCFALAAFAAVLSGSCNSREEIAEAPQNATARINEEQAQFAGIRTGVLERRVISAVVSCTGEIEVPPQGMASVTAPLGGYIVETAMVPGTRVKKGTPLARLSNPEYIVLQQSYLEATGQLSFADQEYRRQKTLEAQNATAVKKLQESESSYKVLQARVAGLKAQLKMIGISLNDLEKGSIQSEILLRAPITGYVTTVNHHPGQFVEPREVIFEIVNIDELHLHLNVFEQDITDVHQGQSIRFRPSGEGMETHAGEVLLVSPQRNEAARTFDVHGHIQTESNKLKPGMYVDAQILMSGDSVYALPENAIVRDGDRTFVVTGGGGGYKTANVVTGAAMDGWVEIKDAEDLLNRQIVVEGASRLFTALRRQDER